MTFQYESMLSKNKIIKIKTAIENKFQYYDSQLKESYHYSVPVGFEREIVSTTDNKIIFNNYDHPVNKPDTNYEIGKLTDPVNTLIASYRQLVNDKKLDIENYKKEKVIYNLHHSDIVSFE